MKQSMGSIWDRRDLLNSQVLPGCAWGEEAFGSRWDG